MSFISWLRKHDLTLNNRATRNVCTAVAVVCLLGPARLSADEVIDWNNILLDTIRTNSIGPPPASRIMATMNTAMYDAVNSIARTHQPYHVDLTAEPGTSREAAAAQAAHRVLSSMVPANLATYNAALANSLSSVPDGSGKTAGIELGNTIGAAILALRANDGASAMVPYSPGSQPGEWRPTPAANAPAAAPQWANVTPWAMTSPSQFRNLVGPPALDSAEYTAAFNQVKEIGSATSATRTVDQSNVALFWAGPAGTSTPVGHWNRIAQTIAESQGNTLEENARLFALVGMTEADALISAWDNKYHFDHWRPVTAIREAEIDGNPDTVADLNWSSFITTPNHPSYTAAHGTLSGAMGALLADFFGTDDITFTTSTEGFVVPDRSYTSFSQASQEASNSRLYGGIHWTFDNEDGLAGGRLLGHHMYATQLQEIPEPATVALIGVALVGLSVASRRRDRRNVVHRLIRSNRATRIVCAVAAALAVSGVAPAAIIPWTLQGVMFSDGSQASGDFTWDADTNAVVDWNVSITDGSNPDIPAASFNSGNSVIVFGNPPDFFDVIFQSTTVGFGGRRLDFRIGIGNLNNLDLPAATLALVETQLTSPGSALLCFNCSPFVPGTGSLSSVTVPELGTLSMLGTGFLGIVLSRRRDRRNVVHHLMRANRATRIVCTAAAALAAITLTVPSASAAYVNVFGGPTFTTGDEVQFVYAAGVNDAGTAVGNMYTEASALDGSYRVVRWDGSGAPAIELGRGGASDINEAGMAVGYVIKHLGTGDPTTTAVRWDASGAATEMMNQGVTSCCGSFAFAKSINNAGVAVGGAEKYGGGSFWGYHAFRWDASGTAATELDSLGLFFNSEGTAINEAGTVVGWSLKWVGSGMSLGDRPVRWDAAGTEATELGNLGTDPSGVTYGGAYDINDAGTAVGWANMYDGSGEFLGLRAVRWDATGTAATELGVLGFSGNFDVTESYAVAINDAGAAVGYAYKYDGSGVYMGDRAVRWDASGTAATELGNLGTDASGYTETNIFGINDAGVAVGSADDYDDFGTNLGERAVYWGLNGVAVDLNTLIDPASGWTFNQAHVISNTGWIGGSGAFDPDGPGGQGAYARLFLIQILAPTNLPGDFNDDGTVDAADYSVWRNNLGAPAGTLPNDVDGGAIGTAQYATWKTNYGLTTGSGALTFATVPEPGTMVLLILAATGWLLPARRSRATAEQS